MLPFLVNRLPEVERSTIDQVVLLGPGYDVDFQFHLRDYLGEAKSKTARSVPTEIEKLKGLPLLVLYGDKDKSTCGAALSYDWAAIRSLPGDHHFGRDYPRMTRVILDALEKASNVEGLPAQSSPGAGGPTHPRDETR